MLKYTAKQVNNFIKTGKLIPVTKTVSFFSPGTMFAEVTTYETNLKKELAIVKEAIKKSENILERYDAMPYGFTIEGFEGTYFLSHCEKKYPKDIPNIPENRILLSNMENNEFEAIVQPTKGWKFTQPFRKEDKMVEEILT